MQLINAEERFTDSCRRYKDLYLDILYFIDYNFGAFIRDIYNKKFDGFVTLGDFKKSYLEYNKKHNKKKMNPFARIAEVDRFNKKLSRYIQTVGIPNQTVLFHIKHQMIWSFCFESYNIRSRNDIFDVDATLRYVDDDDRGMCLWGVED